MILVDSSVWIAGFRRKNPLDLPGVIDIDTAVTCLPIVMEVLQGFDDARAMKLARTALLSLPIVESPLRLEVFEESIRLYQAARRGGFTVRSSVDCLIATCAIRNDLLVLHMDRDYESLARVSALRQRSILG